MTRLSMTKMVTVIRRMMALGGMLIGWFLSKLPTAAAVSVWLVCPRANPRRLPPTWPELPILIDSADLSTAISDDKVEIRVPSSDLGGSADFNFDGVTSGLRVSTSPHEPLLCVDAVFDVAPGDLSLPGEVG